MYSFLIFFYITHFLFIKCVAPLLVLLSMIMTMFYMTIRSEKEKNTGNISEFIVYMCLVDKSVLHAKIPIFDEVFITRNLEKRS